MWDTVWDPIENTGRWLIDDQTGDFKEGNSVATAVILALFTDKPLPVETSVESQRATWNGNTFDTEDEGELGSFLWTLDRSFPDEDVVLRARSYIAEAMQPLIEQKLIRGFTMEVELQKNEVTRDIWLAMSIVTLGSADISFFFKFPVA